MKATFRCTRVRVRTDRVRVTARVVLALAGRPLHYLVTALVTAALAPTMTNAKWCPALRKFQAAFILASLASSMA